MASLQEVHAQSYADMPFDQFAQKYHGKFYADMPFEQFMAKAGGAPKAPERQVIAEDPVKAEVRQELDGLRSKGVPVDNGYARQYLQGATLNTADEILAGLTTPLEMIKRGTFNPVKGYEYAKAREDLLMEGARKNGGYVGAGMEMAGGLGTAIGLSKAGATFMPTAKVVNGVKVPPGLWPTAGGMAADGAVYGAVTGAADANGLDRLTEGAKGAAIGGAVGGVLPIAARGIGMAAAPVVNPIMARVNPEGFASAKLLDAYRRGGMSADDVARSLTEAAGDGQGAFTVADAMGNAGQRMLSAVARIPQDERMAIVKALESRQGDQGRRIGAFLREGFGDVQTAQQTEQALSAARTARADVNYAPVKADPSSIDVSGAVAAANRSISPLADRAAIAQGRVPTDLAARQGVEAGEAAIRDPIREAVKEARSYLASPTLTINNVEKAFRAKTNIDMMIAKATEMGQGGKVAELIPIQRELDAALTRTSKAYAGAKNTYSADSKVVDAVAVGKQAGQGGLPENNIQTFAGLGNEAERSAFRAGYVDPFVSSAQNTSRGTNKAMPLRTTATEAEFPRFAAPGRADQLGRRIERENTMFETRTAALGGSKTADNLADSGDLMKLDPSVLVKALSGDFLGAAKSAGQRIAGEVGGMSPGVAEKLSRALMETNPVRVKAMAEKALENTKISEEKKLLILRALMGASVPASQRK